MYPRACACACLCMALTAVAPPAPAVAPPAPVGGQGRPRRPRRRIPLAVALTHEAARQREAPEELCHIRLARGEGEAAKPKNAGGGGGDGLGRVLGGDWHAHLLQHGGHLGQCGALGGCGRYSARWRRTCLRARTSRTGISLSVIYLIPAPRSARDAGPLSALLLRTGWPPLWRAQAPGVRGPFTSPTAREPQTPARGPGGEPRRGQGAWGVQEGQRPSPALHASLQCAILRTLHQDVSIDHGRPRFAPRASRLTLLQAHRWVVVVVMGGGGGGGPGGGDCRVQF
jgi:hypothetical protein